MAEQQHSPGVFHAQFRPPHRRAGARRGVRRRPAGEQGSGRLLLGPGDGVQVELLEVLREDPLVFAQVALERGDVVLAASRWRDGRPHPHRGGRR